MSVAWLVRIRSFRSREGRTRCWPGSHSRPVAGSTTPIPPVSSRTSQHLDSRITPFALVRQRRDTQLTNSPDVLEAYSPLRCPLADKGPVLVHLVPADLLGRYLLLVEKLFDGSLSPNVAGQVDACSFVDQVAVGLGNTPEPVSLENRTYARSVYLIHLVDPED